MPKILVIILAGFAVYSNSLDVPFHFDDLFAIVEDKSVRLTALSWDGILEALHGGTHTARPLAKLSFAINYYFGEYGVFGYHLVNIAIHVFTAIFLYFFLFLTLSRPVFNSDTIKNASPAAFFASLLWTVHPVQLQGVTYIVQRMTSLASMFYLLAFLLYIKGRLTYPQKSSWAFFLGCFVFWLFSLASKPIGVTFPVLIILYEWFFFQALSKKWLLKNIYFFSASLIVLAGLVYMYMGGSPLETLANTYITRDFTLEQRLLTELRVVVFYLSLLVLPLPGRLNLEHSFGLSHSLVDPIATFFSLACLLSLFYLAVHLARNYRFISYAILWFLGGLVLESSFIGLELVFEHRLYLPSMMILALLPYFFIRFFPKSPKCLYLLFLPIILLATVTYSRNIVWKDNKSLWQDCVSKSPNNPRALSNLANHYLSINDFQRAEPLLARAISANPKYLKALYNMGTVMQNTGRDLQAISYYKKALEIDDEHIGSLNNLSIIYAKMGVFSKAKDYLEKVIDIEPEHEVALTNLGRVFKDMGKPDKAIVYFKRALKAAPDSQEAKYHLERALREKSSGR